MGRQRKWILLWFFLKKWLKDNDIEMYFIHNEG